MIRMSRAGRKQAIISAIKMLNARHKVEAYTKGEICRKMGIKSSSKIRDILNEMVDDQLIIPSIKFIGGRADVVATYRIAKFKHLRLPNHRIKINGVYVETGYREDYDSECRNCGKSMPYNGKGMCSKCDQVWNS